MLGSQHYPEGQYQPRRGARHNWHVWCCTGALQVLEEKEYESWLEANPDERWQINFANGSAARISTSHPLWQALKAVANRYKVQVYRLSLKAEWVPWTGEPGSLSTFDCIAISVKDKE